MSPNKASNVSVFFITHSSEWRGLANSVMNAVIRAGGIVGRADHPSMLFHTPTLESALDVSKAVIVDLTVPSPEVMTALGMAIKAGKPMIAVTRDRDSIPADFSWLQAVTYVFSSPESFESQLAEAVHKLLKNSEQFSPNSLQTTRGLKHAVFISYSHRDSAFHERLLIHLEPLNRAGAVDSWSDKQIRPGDAWKAEIEKALERSTIAVLLVSADFLASRFIAENELPPLLEKAQSQGTRILPLLVKPSRFSRDNDLNRFQAINYPGDELILLDEGHREKYYDKVCQEIELLVKTKEKSA